MQIQNNRHISKINNSNNMYDIYEYIFYISELKNNDDFTNELIFLNNYCDNYNGNKKEIFIDLLGRIIYKNNVKN